VAQTFKTLKEDFDLLTEWEDRYAYIIELGQKLDKLPDEDKNEQTKVRGCLSQVWLVSTIDSDGIYHFKAESDALIVQGLIAVLNLLLNHKPAEGVASINAQAELEAIGLSQHLSPNRRNGLVSMLNRIQEEARTYSG
jgi:cysteine desulfuration protein SufE